MVTDRGKSCLQRDGVHGSVAYSDLLTADVGPPSELLTRRCRFDPIGHISDLIRGSPGDDFGLTRPPGAGAQRWDDGGTEERTERITGSGDFNGQHQAGPEPVAIAVQPDCADPNGGTTMQAE